MVTVYLLACTIILAVALGPSVWTLWRGCDLDTAKKLERAAGEIVSRKMWEGE